MLIENIFVKITRETALTFDSLYSFVCNCPQSFLVEPLRMLFVFQKNAVDRNYRRLQRGIEALLRKALADAPWASRPTSPRTKSKRS